MVSRSSLPIALGPIRSALFAPAVRPERFPRALASPADAVIIDLEDSVALSHKEEARSLVREALPGLVRDKPLLLRVNPLSSPFAEEDLALAAETGFSGVLLPKAETAEEIKAAHGLLTAKEKAAGLTPGGLGLIPMIETPLGLENSLAMLSQPLDGALGKPRPVTAAFGALDFCAGLGVELIEDGAVLAYPRARLAVACRAAGLEGPLDSPFSLRIKDTEALRVDALAAKGLGFQGKLCIHPLQAETVNQVFSPSAREVELALKIIQAFELAEAQGRAALEVEGRMVDYPLVIQARRTVERSRL